MTAALCAPSGEVNIDLSCGDEQGLKNQTGVISSNQTFCERTRISKHLSDSNSIHTYSLIHCHSWSKRNGIYDPQENSPSEIVIHVVFGTWERAPWKPTNRKQRHFYNSLMLFWVMQHHLLLSAWWLIAFPFDMPSQFSYFSLGFTDKQHLKLTLVSYNQG